MEPVVCARQYLLCGTKPDDLTGNAEDSEPEECARASPPDTAREGPPTTQTQSLLAHPFCDPVPSAAKRLLQLRGDGKAECSINLKHRATYVCAVFGRNSPAGR